MTGIAKLVQYSATGFKRGIVWWRVSRSNGLAVKRRGWDAHTLCKCGKGQPRKYYDFGSQEFSGLRH